MSTPLPTKGIITQYFDTPVDYIAGRTTHEALDIVSSNYNPVRAMFSGIVLIAENSVRDYDVYSKTNRTGYGNEVWVVSYNGRVKQRCAHLKQNILVKEGQEVEPNQELGYMGQTGYRFPKSTIHTHYEIYVDGKRVDPLDTDTWEQYLEKSLTIDTMTDLELRVEKLEAEVERLHKRKPSKKKVRAIAAEEAKVRTYGTRKLLNRVAKKLKLQDRVREQKKKPKRKKK